MALEVGSRLGHYNITVKIGEGGMGEVYQATDTQLGRDVALKVLPDAFAEDEDRLARFQREAQVLASLNHPNIAAIHGFEQADGVRALVLELVEGPTLADRIAKGPIPLDEALPIAKQIAEALEAAHEAGVIHRDLKPANIKVRNDGTVKVLDFGLAKALDPTPTGDPSQSPTLTAASTQMGMIMGTAAYMSPEQAAGIPIDRTADVWAFGVVLFEMLAGQRLFTGETVSHVLASVIKTDPDWSMLPSDTPVRLRALLGRCLDRDSKQRLRDMREARIAIARVLSEPTAAKTRATPGAPLRMWQRPVPAAMILVLAMVLSAVAVWRVTGSPPVVSGDATHFAVAVEGGHEMHIGECPRLALSSDGRTLAYVATGRLHLRHLDRLESASIPSTEGAESPFFSPDGRSVGFVQGSVLKSVPVGGGPVVEIAHVASGGYACAGASWSPDGTIIYRPAGARVLFSVPAVGGDPQILTTIRDPSLETFHIWPQVLNGGRQVLFTVIGQTGRWSDARIVVENLDTGKRTTVIEEGTYGRYVPTGHIVFATASGTLFAAPFDPSSGEPAGDRFPVASGIRVAGWGGAASFAVADGGTAAFVRGSNEARQLLWWLDRQGKRIRRVGEPLATYFLDLSPDGTRVAIDIQQTVSGNVWLIDVETGRRERFTFGDGFDQSPAWSSDGRRIAYVTFATEDEGTASIEVLDADNAGAPVRVYTPEAATDLFTWSWSPDGWIAFTEAVGGNHDIYAVYIDDPEQRIPVAVSAASETAPQFSPDGRWLAYDSDETGRQETFVVAFPDIGRAQQVSTDGGQIPRWSATGHELFFWQGTTLMVSEISTRDRFSWGTARALFDVPDIEESLLYDVAPDGGHFIVAVKNLEASAREIHVVENWLAELRRLASAY